ncbi:hypothetical protein [Streptomyces sp. NPDC006784]|uniref:hypothetical protein n=1 Tax=Streptomyces sp. NPDC006784 TaxID=3364764 RepID=UPI0036C45378
MTTPPQPPNQPQGGGGFGPPSAGGYGQPQDGGPGQPQAGGYGQPQDGGQGQQPQGGAYGQPQAGAYGQPQGGGYGQPQDGGFGQPPGNPGGPGAPGGFGQPGQPGFPAPYGSPQPPPPNRSNRSNKVVGIVVAAVLVVALAVAGTLLVLSGGSDDKDDGADDKVKPEKSDSASEEPTDDSSSPEPTPSPSETTYELKFPKTLDDGQYRLKKDLSDSVDPGQPGEEAHLGSYANPSGSSRLLYGAATGEDYGNPEMSKNQMMDGMESGSAMSVAVKRRDITPTGGDPLTCEVLVKSQAGRKLTIPVCAWSDPGTAAYVAKDAADTYGVDPKKVDLEAWADRVNDIRDEVRVPADG